MLAVIDYGAGNLRSVLHALHHLRVPDIRLAREPADLKGASRLILPGVGAFGAGMQQLREQGLVEPLRAAVRAGMPYLGICLGMQFLFEFSDEMGQHEGLGLLPGRVTRFAPLPGIKVPHMGWNAINPSQPGGLAESLPSPAFAFFVHSYYCLPADERDVLFRTEHGISFAAGVQRDAIYGVQFHPEKSQSTGLHILRRFLEISA